MLEIAGELTGFPRHLSQHTGGFVITRTRLDEVTPIANAAMDGRTTIEWDKDDLDTLRILKIDVLALGMLSCLKRGFDLLHKHHSEKLTDSPSGASRGEMCSRYDFARRIRSACSADREPRANVDAAAVEAGQILRSRH